MDGQLIIDALKYGPSGLAAVMLYLTQRMIAAEQNHQGAPRPGLLKVMRLYMGFALVLMLSGVFVYFVDANQRHNARLAAAQAHLTELANSLNDKDAAVRRLHLVTNDENALSDMLRRINLSIQAIKQDLDINDSSQHQ